MEKNHTEERYEDIINTVQNQNKKQAFLQKIQQTQFKIAVAQTSSMQRVHQSAPKQQISLTIEEVLSSKYQQYLKHKQLLKDLLYIQQQKVLQSYYYLWEKSGKKLRMILALMINDLFCQELKPQIVRIGGLIELLHCASLIIDDIEDGSLKRRGEKCAHLVFGVDSAINSANLMYFMPAHRLFSGVTDPLLKWPLAQVFLYEMTLCHIGQGLDVRVHGACSQFQLPLRQEYFRLTSLKTGGLLRMMVKMLSIVLKMDKKAEAVLVDCVNGLGVAFQIADDLLNLARSDNMGKGVIAEDLHQRKFTLIVDQMRYNQQFMYLFFKKQKTPEQIERMLYLIEISGALERCKKVAQTYAFAAVSVVDTLQCPYSMGSFKLFIRYIVDRKS